MNKNTRAIRYCLPAVLGGLAMLVATACSDGDEKTALPSLIGIFLEVASGDDQEGETGQELPKPISVRARAHNGQVLDGKTIYFEVTAGGGSLSAASAVTGRDGVASVYWTLGVPPVWNRVQAQAEGSTVTFLAWAEPGEEPKLEFLYQTSPGTSSEDLAFWPGRGLFLGSPGAILHAAGPGGDLSVLELTGESIQGPVGIAFGPAGDLFACESAPPLLAAVKRIAPSGACEILSEGFGGEPFALPNYIAVDGSGNIYLTATCASMIYRIDPRDGTTSEFLAIQGPNGLAFDKDHAYLYITTENIALFCLTPSRQGGLFRVAIGPDGEPGEIETLVEDFAFAGDGLAFDEEGNLYVVFSGILGGGFERFQKSGVFVYTPEGTFREFLSVDILRGDIITNVAFGAEPFDPYSLYCYGFTGKLYRVGTGIRGLLLP